MQCEKLAQLGGLEVLQWVVLRTGNDDAGVLEQYDGMAGVADR